jgi:hypothetical protein
MRIRMKLVEVAHPVSFGGAMQRRLQDRDGLIEFDTEERMLHASPRGRHELLIPETNIVFMQVHTPEVLNKVPKPDPVELPRRAVDDTVRFVKDKHGQVVEVRGALDALVEASVEDDEECEA